MWYVINFILFGCDIARGAKIDGGLYLPHSSGVVIGEYSIIGKNCIINTKSLIEHECEISDHCHISTNAVLNGSVKMKSKCERKYKDKWSV